MSRINILYIYTNVHVHIHIYVPLEARSNFISFQLCNDLYLIGINSFVCIKNDVKLKNSFIINHHTSTPLEFFAYRQIQFSVGIFFPAKISVSSFWFRMAQNVYMYIGINKNCIYCIHIGPLVHTQNG